MGQSNRNWLVRGLDVLSRGLIAVHILLLFRCAEWQVMPAAGVTAACAAAGCIGLRLLRKGHFRAHMLTLYICELIQIIVCVVCMGWSAGFQIPLVGLTLLVFFAEYLGRSLKMPYIPALPLGIVSFAVYLLVFPFFFHKPGLLPVPQSALLTVEIPWSVLVLAAVIAGLHSSVRMTMDSERVLSNEAKTDALTGLYNRDGYDALCAAADLHTTTLLLVDVDKFKGINDRFGHEIGDRVLKKIARSLKQNFRREDSVCRIGGDEFAVLMPNNTAPEDETIREKVMRINRELSNTVDDSLPPVSISVGGAHGGGTEDWTALFRQADAALYQVKEAGRRGFRFYRP